MDGRYIEGYAAEVCYKPAIPVPHQGPYGVPPSDPNADYAPPPPPRSMWSGPIGPNPFIAPAASTNCTTHLAISRCGHSRVLLSSTLSRGFNLLLLQ